MNKRPIRSMRILALTNLYPRAGKETFAAFNRQQFRALADVHDVRVVAPVPWVELLPNRLLDRTNTPGGVNFDGIRVWHPRYYYPPKILQHHYGSFYLKSVRRTVLRLIKEQQSEVILACWAHPDGWAAVRLSQEAGVPVVIKVIGSDVLVAAKNARRRQKVVTALREAHAVTAVSRDLASNIIGLGLDSSRVHVVPEGLDQRLFAPGDRARARARLGLPASRPMLLFVGNLLYAKGAGVLLDSCRTLRDGGLDFDAYLVGTGRDARRLYAHVSRLKLGQCVTFAGPRPHSALPDWYHACDLVVLPSFSEGIPNVLREASACGRPYVATLVGGIPEIADPRTSRLVAPRDAAALADAIAETLADPPAPEVFTKVKASCSWEESAARLGEILGAVVESPGQRNGRDDRPAAIAARNEPAVPEVV